ncbi:MAG: hypothetical protein ACI9KE_005520 [Polyangiales bacterium]|jgi:hypothetical protein
MKATPVFLSALLASFAALTGSSASAQCPPGAVVCASANVRASANVQVSGSISIGGTPRARQVAPPPPLQQPQGRIVVVQQAPVAPPQQQVVVYQPPQQYVQEDIIIIEQEPARLRLRPVMNQKFGITGRLGGIIAENVRMGGFAAGIRFRPSRMFGVELNIGAYGGQDYNGHNRVEVPIAFDFMFHLPRASRFQMYLVIGPQVSWAATDGFDAFTTGYISRSFVYLGGHAGIGGELRLSDHFAISADIRGFIRSRVDDDGRPEFVNFATGETTNTSAGGILNVGAHLYF